MSKFDKLFEARGVKTGSKKASAKKSSAGTKSSPERKDAAEPASVTGQGDAGGNKKRRGRPSGKRTDPNYVGFTTYIRKETHRSVKRALFDDPDERELSELVEDLLTDWLKTKSE